jgi:large conductance mechanosensitive channel
MLYLKKHKKYITRRLIFRKDLINMGFIQEFKEFAVKGNVIDLAVGVIIGGAFGKITSSLIDDIIMPPIGLIIGGVNFKDLKCVLKDAIMEGNKVVTPEVAFKYGNFIQNLLDFTILAFAVFLMVKAINSLKKAPVPVVPVEPPQPTREEVLLAEIRDAIKQKG